MEPNLKYANLADEESLNKTVEALGKNGFDVTIVETGEEAKAKALSLISEGSEVYQTTSVTLDQIGLSKEINDSGKFDSIRKKIYALDRATQSHEMKRLGDTPHYVIGSVHAVTEDGKVLIASRSGSQLPSYAHGADHVVWVVSTKKIVKDLEDGIKRLHEYSLPKESVRVQSAYGMAHSDLRKILIFNQEEPGRISIILVKEDLGY
jgi:L-lactate utilization protein LutC